MTSPALSDLLEQRRARRVGLVALCITEVISWGVLYYAFPVALTDITAETGWSRGATSAAFSAGLVVSALAGIAAGRVLDARGPRLVMTAGSVLAVPAVAGVALAPTVVWFAAAWIVAGFAMSATLYPPAFAALTGWYGPQRMKALTVLTLVAGLSSTIFAPLTAWLLQNLTWRQTYLVLGATLALSTIPLHALALRTQWSPHGQDDDGHRAPAVRKILTSAAFVSLCASFTVLALGFYVASLGLIPLLVERGFTPALAATTLGLLGAGQLLGRVAYAPLARRLHPVGRLVVVVVLAAVAMLGLAFFPPAAGVLIAAAVVLGAMRGIVTLLQASVVADRWGTGGYGTLSGVFSAPVTAATAIAPWAAAASADALGNSVAMFTGLAALTLASLVAGVWSWRVRQ